MRSSIVPLALAVLVPLLPRAAAVAPGHTDPAFLASVVEAPTHLARNKLLADDDFVFTFAKDGAVSEGLGGRALSANAGNFPALIGEGVAMTLGLVGPCGLNTPHTHPRAAEFNYVVNGSFTTGMFQENGARVVLGNVTAGQASLFPRGAIHFEANLDCTPSFFVAAFGSEDPGTLQVAQALFGLPPSIVAATMGNDLTFDQIKVLKALIPEGIAVGLDECVKRCGLKFDQPSTSALTIDGGTGKLAAGLSGKSVAGASWTEANIAAGYGASGDDKFSPKYFGAGIGVGAIAMVLLGLLAALAYNCRRRMKAPKHAAISRDVPIGETEKLVPQTPAFTAESDLYNNPFDPRPTDHDMESQRLMPSSPAPAYGRHDD